MITRMIKGKGEHHVSFKERRGSHPMYSSRGLEDGEVNHLSSYETLVAGGDKMKEILLRRSKSNVDKILCDIVKEMLMQKLASLHYEALGTWMLYAPTMFVTLFSACISIFSTSELVKNQDLKAELTIGVAFLQLFLSVLQSLSKQLDYSAKAGFHRSAARTLEKIYGNARRKEFENRYHTYFKALKGNKKRLSVGMNAFGYDHDSSSSDDDSDDESSNDSAIIPQPDQKSVEKEDDDSAAEGGGDENGATETKKPEKKKKTAKKTQKKKQMRDTDSICKQFRQAMDQVDSFVPVRIANAFNVLENRIRIINESLMTDKTQSLVAWEQVLPALYFQLGENIIESTGWPFFCPAPSYIVNETLKEFKDLLKVHDNEKKKDENNADLLMRIMDRSTEIREVQLRLAKKRSQRKSSKVNDRDMRKDMVIAASQADHLSSDSADRSSVELEFGYPSSPTEKTSLL